MARHFNEEKPQERLQERFQERPQERFPERPRERPQEEASIDLVAVFFVLIRKWPLYLVSFFVAAALVFAVSEFIIPKEYRSTLELYVNSSNQVSASADVTTGTVDAARRLANTYIVILQNPTVTEQISQQLNGEVTPGELPGYLSMNALENTEVVQIAVQTRDPVLSRHICDAYAAIAPSVLDRVVKAGSAQVIGISGSTGSVYPNVLRNTLIGGLAGLIIALAIVYLRFLLDKTVKDGLELSRELDIVLLGEIPSFNSKVKPGSTYEKTGS